MTTRTRPALLALLALFPLLGCGVNSLLNRIDNETDKTIDLACSCKEVFPDTAACEAQFSSFFDVLDRECVEDALAVDKKASKATLECFLDHAKKYNDCLEDKLVCTDPNSFQSCQTILETKCPDLPAEV